MSSYFRIFVEITSWQAEKRSIVWFSGRWNKKHFRLGAVGFVLWVCRWGNTVYCKAVLSKSWSLRNNSCHLRQIEADYWGKHGFDWTKYKPVATNGATAMEGSTKWVVRKIKNVFRDCTATCFYGDFYFVDQRIFEITE